MNISHITLALTLLTASSLAISGQNIACNKTNKTENSIQLSGNSINVEIDSPEASCDSKFEYEKSNSSKKIIITAWPTQENLGVNAQRDLFIALDKNSKANYMGSIPVDAEIIDDNVYRNISQNGGSIYEDVYYIKNDTVKIKKISKELMIDGEQCIFSNERSAECTNYSASFKNPICLYNNGVKKIIADKELCKNLIRP